jgi:hypothetical protein
MKKAILGSLAVLPLAAAGVLAGAGAAEAIALTGIVQFSSETSPASLVEITENTAFFTPNPGNANIGFSNGTFKTLGFTELSLLSEKASPTLELGASGTNELFLDFGTDAATTNDGVNIFRLTSVADNFTFNTEVVGGIPLTQIGLSVGGFFVGAGDEITQGAGTLTFQAPGFTEDQIKNQIATGSFGDMTFSGAVIGTVDVPEPATMLGLGVVAGSLALTRAGKKNKA